MCSNFEQTAHMVIDVEDNIKKRNFEAARNSLLMQCT